jgi:hypothetical protein
MQESSRKEDECRQDTANADSEATSKETLADVEEDEAESGASDAGLDPGPSPDGLLDEPDEIKDAGPM